VIKEINEYVRGTLYTLMQAAATNVGRAVQPIYVASEQGRPKHHGSCVLINYRSRYLLVTAAHVIDARKITSLFIPVQGSLHPLTGDGLSTVAPSGNRERDHFDFSIIELHPGLVGALGPVRYLLEHELQTQPAAGRAYMAFGFPNSQNKRIDHLRRKVVAERFSYGGPLFVGQPANGKLSGSVEKHLLRIKYEKQSRSIEGHVVNSIDPVGISGGGFFDLGRILAVTSAPVDPPKLAGILIERRRKERALVAVAISTVLDVLKGQVPPDHV
jgi:hypothetical protein